MGTMVTLLAGDLLDGGGAAPAVDGGGLQREVGRGLVGQQAAQFVGQFAELLGRDVLVAQQADLVADQRVLTWMTGMVGTCESDAASVASAAGPAVRLPKPALAPRLVQADAGGHRDVQALHRAGHRDAHQFVAVLRVSWRMPAPSAPSTRATGPLRSASYSVCSASSLVPMMRMSRSFSLGQRARQVGHHQVGHGFGRTAGHLGHGGVQTHRVVLGRHHGVRAGAVGHAQAGAQVVRVGHAVQHQHQRRAHHVVQHLVQRMPGRQRLHARHHALVARRAGQPARRWSSLSTSLAPASGHAARTGACGRHAAWRRHGSR
jgi:hypothetical protein